MAVRPEVDEFIEFLNSLLEKDPECMSALIANRVPCNKSIEEHVSVQVGVQDGKFVVGFLGIVNGFMGTIDSGNFSGWGPISAVVSKSAKVLKFVRTGSE
jgi:hypothetical protein